MFVYQNKENTQVFINVTKDIPTVVPEYILEVTANGVLTVNGVEIDSATAESLPEEVDAASVDTDAEVDDDTDATE